MHYRSNQKKQHCTSNPTAPGKLNVVFDGLGSKLPGISRTRLSGGPAYRQDLPVSGLRVQTPE
ncbi:uncharacterized protein P174DRAFT_437401 [Aspergillus novofumigatus IBT 16806]|uniref:Uncharacterized protein n=1 Tax=Aspergillus novofumigatus (strain IBT 16806) TaxID=1392255 RepID=A0A2I1CMY2_ASPN1|nr:uncharacterized protein P174DRAFT_437401 [Aspergillus novofumigatus IBT 16806]PKX98962.1 hypothetical protein P174DRAFT_437401 [Aspergillus novofumigatus IBT 16806]